jgi:hypothetical protein
MTLDISILASMDITVLLTICMRHQIYFKETNGKTNSVELFCYE